MKKIIIGLLALSMAAASCNNPDVDKNRDALEGQNEGTNNGNPGDENGIPVKDSTDKR